MGGFSTWPATQTAARETTTLSKEGRNKPPTSRLRTLPQGESLIPRLFPHQGLSQTEGPGGSPSPQGRRAPAPEPSNGEQAGWHTTYPELLELGPGQGGVRGCQKEPHSLQALESST